MLKTLAISFATLCYLAQSSSAGEIVRAKELPLFRDHWTIELPEDFEHVYEKGALNYFIKEYVPKGETVEDWTQLVTIGAIGAAGDHPNAERVMSRFLAAQSELCLPHTFNIIEKSTSKAVYTTDCEVRKGHKLPGAKRNVTREIVFHRIVKSTEATYHLQFAWHDKSRELSREETRQKFYSKADEVLSTFNICDLMASAPCTGLDIYALGSKPVEVIGDPPCRTKNEVPCNSAAILTIEAGPRANPNPKQKKGLLIVSLEKDELNSMSFLNETSARAAGVLMKGAPAVLLVVRGAGPHAKVSSKDRVLAGTFLNLVQRSLVQHRYGDPNTTSIAFTNFR